MKKSTIAMLLVAAVLSTSGTVYAYGHGKQQQSVIANLPDDKKQQFYAIMEQQRATVQPLRIELQSKRMELNALSTNANATPENIAAVSDEINALQQKIFQAGQSTRERVSKELGVNLPIQNMGNHAMNGRKGQQYNRNDGHGRYKGASDCPWYR